jgi:DNA repair ATPase RecN
LADLQGETNARLEQACERIDQTNERLDLTNERLEQTNERLDQHDTLLVSLVDMQRVQGQQLGTLVDMHRRSEKKLTRIADGMDSLNDRFDNFLTGEHRTGHVAVIARLDRIEARLDLAPIG